MSMLDQIGKEKRRINDGPAKPPRWCATPPPARRAARKPRSALVSAALGRKGRSEHVSCPLRCPSYLLALLQSIGATEESDWGSASCWRGAMRPLLLRRSPPMVQARRQGKGSPETVALVPLLAQATADGSARAPAQPSSPLWELAGRRRSRPPFSRIPRARDGRKNSSVFDFSID